MSDAPKKRGRRPGTKNPEGHSAGRPLAGLTENPPRISREAMAIFRELAQRHETTMRKTIEDAAKMLQTVLAIPPGYPKSVSNGISMPAHFWQNIVRVAAKKWKDGKWTE